jgi:hypothetical protein
MCHTQDCCLWRILVSGTAKLAFGTSAQAVTTFASFVCPSIPSDKQTRLGKNIGISTIRTIP